VQAEKDKYSEDKVETEVSESKLLYEEGTLNAKDTKINWWGNGLVDQKATADNYLALSKERYL
jgi:hypothetical protein